MASQLVGFHLHFRPTRFYVVWIMYVVIAFEKSLTTAIIDVLVMCSCSSDWSAKLAAPLTQALRHPATHHPPPATHKMIVVDDLNVLLFAAL